MNNLKKTKYRYSLNINLQGVALAKQQLTTIFIITLFKTLLYLFFSKNGARK